MVRERVRVTAVSVRYRSCRYAADERIATSPVRGVRRGACSTFRWIVNTAIGLIAVHCGESIFPCKGNTGGYIPTGVKRATDGFFTDNAVMVNMQCATGYNSG